MLAISFKPSFVKRFNKLPKRLQEEVLEKIEVFKDRVNHEVLKVHKLHSPLCGCYSFSIDFKHRIIFEYPSDDEATLLTIGDHEIYD